MNLPFVWEVQKNGAPSFVIGTAHFDSKDKDVENIAVAARPVVDKASIMYVETPEDFKLDSVHTTLPGEQTISQLLQPEEVQKVDAFFRQVYGQYLFPEEVQANLQEMQRKKLWWLESAVVSSMYSGKEKEYLMAKKRIQEIKNRFTSPITPSRQEILNLRTEVAGLVASIQSYEAHADKTPPTLDNALRHYASSVGVKIIGLDTPDDYTAIRDSVSLETQKYRLLQSLEQAKEDILPSRNETAEAYKQGDTEAILRFLENDSIADLEYINRVSHGRTALWYPKTKDQLAHGRTLLMLGIGHILTEQGYLTRLQADGFSVKKLE